MQLISEYVRRENISCNSRTIPAKINYSPISSDVNIPEVSSMTSSNAISELIYSTY